MDGDERRTFNAYTLETTVNTGRNWVWTRVEHVDRDASLIAGETAGHGAEEPIGRIQAWAFGYERELPAGSVPIRVGIGTQATFYTLPSVLKPIYGNRPAGLMVFLRIRPKGNMMLHMQSMHQH